MVDFAVYFDTETSMFLLRMEEWKRTLWRHYSFFSLTKTV